MIPLRVRGVATPGLRNSVVGRLTSVGLPQLARPDHILRIGGDTPAAQDLRGYAGLLSPAPCSAQFASLPAIEAAPTSHLVDGDIVALDPTGQVRTLIRRQSPSNFLFTTDRCNSYCLMCSQPPRQVDDSWRLPELLRVVELIDPETQALGITGGEPTLLKDDLIELLRACRDRLPRTALHVLSNGRLFAYPAFTRAVGAIGHPDLMFGIPLYSDLDWQHDYVVQARGAFDETLAGLLNLAAHDVSIEIRVVLHRHTTHRLVDLANFIYRNLTFAQHVAFMGLEPIGLAIPNLDDLWIDPIDYSAALEEATWYLARRGMRVSIYNHQLCTVPPSIWRFCRQSISDWKREFLPACKECALRGECGGFFTSSIQRRVSQHIRPFLERPENDVHRIQSQTH